MKLSEICESSSDDWEPEPYARPTRDITVSTDPGRKWQGWAATSHIFDRAFGEGEWSTEPLPISGEGPVKVHLYDGAKVDYRTLRDEGFHIRFLEDKESRQYTLENLPNYIRLGDGYVLHRRPDTTVPTYDLKLMFEDGLLGSMTLHEGDDSSFWKFKIYSDDPLPERVFKHEVAGSHLYNHLKLRWWAKNRLIEAGLMAPIVQLGEAFDADDNYGFRPEYRQFRFQVSDPEKYGKEMDRLAGDKTRMSDVESWLIARALREVMARTGAGSEQGWTLLSLGALRGNNPIDTPMVVMINPRIAKPNTKKLKELGMKPVFLESERAY